MKTSNFTHSLHFRMSALFLVLLGLSIGGYYLWIDATVFKAYESKEEKDWYENQEETELADLARQLGPVLDQDEARSRILRDYGARIAGYNAEVSLFDNEGHNLLASTGDSLAATVAQVDPSLLRNMADDDWDYSSYPVDTDIDAYENRIIDVVPVTPPGVDGGPPAAYLVASFQPVTVAVGELDSDWRSFGFRALVLVLIYAIITALIIMAWASRRISNLTRGVEAFTAGNFDHRVSERSADEIGILGRHFNTMASRIQTMMDELGAKEQFQRQLIANVSHDLRTPLASLRGYVETLSLDPDNLSQSERNNYLDIITKNLDHLDQLIERTLILSRLESGQAHSSREDFPLGELTDSVLARCETIAEGARVDLELEMGRDPEGFLVNADALQISQALQNLVENGIKFNKPGGSVIIRLIPHPTTIEVRVTDTGTGIPPEDLPHIFDRFYIGEKSRTRSALSKNSRFQSTPPVSNGLGLAIAHKIITTHGSELKVASEPGRGTVFSFHLPRSAAADLQAHAADG